MMNLEKLKLLKQMLSREKELDSIWSFYMDNFADYPEFTDLGEPTRHPLVEAVAAQIGKQLFNESVGELLLIKIPDYQFIHGPLIIGGRTGGVIYFEETKTGMLAICESLSSSMVKYSRFSGQDVTSSQKAWLN